MGDNDSDGHFVFQTSTLDSDYLLILLKYLNLQKKLSYRKDNRAMSRMYGCPENFRESLTTRTATFTDIFPKFLMGFCSDGPSECSATGQIWNP